MRRSCRGRVFEHRPCRGSAPRPKRCSGCDRWCAPAPCRSCTSSTWVTGTVPRAAFSGGSGGGFGAQTLAVRSSARAEDGERASMAGAYLSRLGVNGADLAETAMAIRQVIASYAGDRRDQVLVQPMLGDIAMSGVVMTHDLTDGAPYYVINYDDESERRTRSRAARGSTKPSLFAGTRISAPSRPTASDEWSPWSESSSRCAVAHRWTSSSA